MRWICFNLPNPSSRTIALGSTQPLTGMSTRNPSGGKGWPARKADKLTAMCKPIVVHLLHYEVLSPSRSQVTCHW
jgi:hypothetical protein